MSANDFQRNLQKNKDPTLNEGDLPEPLTFIHDQFFLFGDSITQSDGDPTLSFSCYQALQHGKGIRTPRV